MAPPPRFVTHQGARVSIPELARRARVSLQCMRWRVESWPEARWLDPKKQTVKLTDELAMAMGRRIRTGESVKLVAACYGVSESWAWQVARGRRKI